MEWSGEISGGVKGPKFSFEEIIAFFSAAFTSSPQCWENSSSTGRVWTLVLLSACGIRESICSAVLEPQGWKLVFRLSSLKQFARGIAEEFLWQARRKPGTFMIRPVWFSQEFCWNCHIPGKQLIFKELTFLFKKTFCQKIWSYLYHRLWLPSLEVVGKDLNISV